MIFRSEPVTIADPLQISVAQELPYAPCDAWLTIGSWPTEDASGSALDTRLEAIGLFRVYREVSGTLMHPRPRQRERAVRIDRLLVPTSGLLAMGWTHQTIGVEVKRSGVNIGPPLGQALDYVHSVFDIGGAAVMPTAVFLWPVATQAGPLASVMVSARVGTASFSGSDRLKFALGEEVLFADNSFSGIRIRDGQSGRHVGSR